MLLTYVLCGRRIQNDWASRTRNLKSNFVLSLNIVFQKLFEWFRRLKVRATGDWQLHQTTCLLMYHISCRDFWQNIKSRWLSTPYSPDLAPCDFWFFPKLKSPLKGKKFQTIHEIQENMTGQLDGYWENTDWENRVRSQGAYFEWGLKCQCPVSNVSWILYLLQ